MTRANRIAVLGIWCLLLVGGCQNPKSDPVRTVLPLPVAAQILNTNIDRIDGTLQAVGSVDGQFTLEDGRTRGYHLDGVLFYLEPRFFRFDLRKLGTTQILIGSNADRYWVYLKDDDTHQCGHHGDPTEITEQLPVIPHELIEALGLTRIPMGAPEDGGVPCVQRVVDEYQQVLFVTGSEVGGAVLTKEYWLDRREPGLVRHVVFRDAWGGLEMESRLDDYRLLGEGGPWLPRIITVEWPAAGTSMRFHVRRWRVVPQVKPDGVQFATPSACMTD